MTKKIIYVCDSCGSELEYYKTGIVDLKIHNNGDHFCYKKECHLCKNCAIKIVGEMSKSISKLQKNIQYM